MHIHCDTNLDCLFAYLYQECPFGPRMIHSPVAHMCEAFNDTFLTSSVSVNVLQSYCCVGVTQIHEFFQNLFLELLREELSCIASATLFLFLMRPKW